ncbi:hypothetical protein FPV67DRAFT_1428985, partial [Lyophyllum atratum]
MCSITSIELRGDGADTPEILEEVREGKLREAPNVLQASHALKDLNEKIKGPSKGKGGGYKAPTDLDPFVRVRLEGMRTFLNLYTDPRSNTFEKWGASSYQAALGLGRGRYCARTLRRLSCAYIRDREVLPINPYGDWNETMLVDEDLVNDISLYLQELGVNITAAKLVEYLRRPEVKEKHGITRPISIRTAHRYLQLLGYRFQSTPKGQFADGHERADVVYYRDNKFLPQLAELQKRMRVFVDANPEYGPIIGLLVILWLHDESIFYAHDRRRRAWYHKDATARPYKKGDGASLMIADYVSADFGWLRSLDGKRSAR